MDEVEIIKLSPDRWEEYRDLRLKGLKESNNPWYSEALKTPDIEWKERLEAALEGKDRWMFFAQMSGKLVGMLQGTLENEDTVKIKAVFVNEEERRKGIGKKLMSRLIEEVKKAPSVKKIDLGVYVPNEAAIALYEGLGFKIVGKGVEKMVNGELQDRVAMEKILH